MTRTIYRQPEVDPSVLALYPVYHAGESGQWGGYDPYFYDLNYRPYLTQDLPVEEFEAFDLRVPETLTPPTSGIPGCWAPRGMTQNAGDQTLYQQDTGTGSFPITGNPGYNLLPQHGQFWFGYEPIIQGKYFGDIDANNKLGDDAPEWMGTVNNPDIGGWPRFYPRRMHTWEFVDIAGDQPVRGSNGSNYYGPPDYMTNHRDFTGRVHAGGEGNVSNNAWTSTGWPVLCILRGYKLWMLTLACELDSGDQSKLTKTVWWSIGGYDGDLQSWGEAIHVADIRELEQDPTLQATANDPPSIPHTVPGQLYPHAKEFESHWNGLIQGQFFRQVWSNDISNQTGPLIPGFTDGSPLPIAASFTEHPKTLHGAFKSRAGTALTASQGHMARAPLCPAKRYGVGLHVMMHVGTGERMTAGLAGAGQFTSQLTVWYLNPFQMNSVFQGVTEQGLLGGGGVEGEPDEGSWRDITKGYHSVIQVRDATEGGKWNGTDFEEFAFLLRVAHHDAPHCIGQKYDETKLWAGHVDPFHEPQRDLSPDLLNDAHIQPHVVCLRDDRKTLIEEIEEGPQFEELRPLKLRDYDRRPESTLHGAREVVIWTKGHDIWNLLGSSGPWVSNRPWLLPRVAGWWFYSPLVKEAGAWLAEYPKVGTVPASDQHVPLKVEKIDLTTEDHYSGRAALQGEEGWINDDGSLLNHCPIAVTLTPYGDFITVSIGQYPHPDDGFPDHYFIVERHGHWKHKIRIPYSVDTASETVEQGNPNRWGDNWPSSDNADHMDMHISCDEKWLHLRNFPARVVPMIPDLHNNTTDTLPGGAPLKQETDNYSVYCSDMRWYEGIDYDTSEPGSVIRYKNWGNPSLAAAAEFEENCASEWMVDLATGKIRFPWRSDFGGNHSGPFKIDSIDNKQEQNVLAGTPPRTYTGIGASVASHARRDGPHFNVAGAAAMSAHIHLPGEGVPASSAPTHFV